MVAVPRAGYLGAEERPRTVRGHPVRRECQCYRLPFGLWRGLAGWSDVEDESVNRPSPGWGARFPAMRDPAGPENWHIAVGDDVLLAWCDRTPGRVDGWGLCRIPAGPSRPQRGAADARRGTSRPRARRTTRVLPRPTGETLRCFRPRRRTRRRRRPQEGARRTEPCARGGNGSCKAEMDETRRTRR